MTTAGKLRKHHSADFKLQVALACIEGTKTLAQICSEYGVAATQVKEWKKTLLESGSMLFERGKKQSSVEPSENVERLQKTIGRLKVENDFLAEFARRHRLL